MIKIFYGIIVSIVIAAGATPAISQNPKAVAAMSSSSEATEVLFPDLENQLISLDSIVKYAIDHSPYLKYDSAMIDVAKMDVKLARREWHRNITGFANYSKGDQHFFIQNEALAQQNNLINGYRYGVNVNIPLADFTNRKTKVRQNRSEMEAYMYKREQTELELRRQVVQEYNNLIAAQKVLKIKGENVENLRVLKQLGEKQFREGSITLEDYAMVSDMATKAEADYEVAKGNFKIIYQQFENLIGVKLTTLMRRR